MTGGSVGWPAAGISVISTCILPARRASANLGPRPNRPSRPPRVQARISLRRLSLHTAPATPVALAPYIDQTFDLATLPARQEEPLENLGGKPVFTPHQVREIELGETKRIDRRPEPGFVNTRTQRAWWSM